MNFTSNALSATCIEYRFGTNINKSINDTVLRLYRALPFFLDLKQEGIRDLVPSYIALAVHFTSSCKLFTNPHAYDQIIEELLSKKQVIKPKEHTLYVNYNGEDIDDVCKKLNLSKPELIDLHTNTYSIAMIGFREYFPYLLGLDEKLFIPRRDAPRSKVKKGSVAIAAGQTGIYPEDSPGGWHIIGHTNFDAFSTLKPADIITFKEATC